MSTVRLQGSLCSKGEMSIESLGGSGERSKEEG